MPPAKRGRPNDQEEAGPPLRRSRRIEAIEARNFSPFSILPDIMVTKIFGYLDIVTQIRARSVSKKWNKLLRDPAIAGVVVLDERLFQEEAQYYQVAKEFLNRQLRRAKVWKHVEHLVLIGTYDPFSNDPNDHYGHSFVESRFYGTLMAMIQESRGLKTRKDDFAKLQSLEFRNIAVVLGPLDLLRGQAALRCRITVTSGSFTWKWNDHLAKEGLSAVEFPVKGTRVFDCSSGKTVSVMTQPELHLSEADQRQNSVPAPIGEFIMGAINAVTDEMVSQFGALYSELLKGRDGMIIRPVPARLFKRFESGDNYNPRQTHWQQCRKYNYITLNKMVKYALAYYTNPRNFFMAESPVNRRSGHFYI